MSKAGKSSSGPDGVILPTTHYPAIVHNLYPHDALLLIITKDLVAKSLVSVNLVHSATGVPDLAAIYAALCTLESIKMLRTVHKQPGDEHIFSVTPQIILINSTVKVLTRKRMGIKRVGPNLKEFGKWISKLDSVRIYDSFEKLPQRSRRLGEL